MNSKRAGKAQEDRLDATFTVNVVLFWKCTLAVTLNNIFLLDTGVQFWWLLVYECSISLVCFKLLFDLDFLFVK